MINEPNLGIKELYDVSIRLNNPVEIEGRKYDINESILQFKTAELAQIDEQKRSAAAKGGYHNPELISWEVDKAVNFGITHGVLSASSWALLSNSKIETYKNKSVTYQETLALIEDEDYCYADLKHCPNCFLNKMGIQGNPCNEPLPMGRRPELLLKPLPPSRERYIFCYDYETGKRIRDFEFYQNRIFFRECYRKVVVDYTFNYDCGIVRTIHVGDRLWNGYLRLDGKMTVKDEKSGEVSTAILEIPKLKLASSLSMRLGKNMDYATVSDFYFTGYPDENVRREKQQVCQITFLDKELTGDYI